MDHSLDAVVIGAKIKCLGTSLIGAKLFAHDGVDAKLAVMWQLMLGTNTIGAEL
jgi:hypothetical protein